MLRQRAAKRNVGRRCHWRDRNTGRIEGSGTIIGVKTRGSWPMYVVDWDADAPDWWGSEVSASHGPQFVIDTVDETAMYGGDDAPDTADE